MPFMTHDSYHHGDLREELVQAALRIVAREGSAALTLREVARRAGVSHAAPYHHFADRAAMMAAVAERGFGGLREAMRAALETAGRTPHARMQAVGAAYVQFAASHPGLFRVMFGPELSPMDARPSLCATSDEAFAVLVSATQAVLRAPTADDPRVQGAALAAWSLVHGLATLWNDTGLTRSGADLATLTRTATDVLRHGLQRLPADARPHAARATPKKRGKA